MHCHSVGPATVSRKTPASAIGCEKFYCALTSVWRTSTHFPLFFTQTLALLYVPDMSLPSEVCCIVALYLVTAPQALGKRLLCPPTNSRADPPSPYRQLPYLRFSVRQHKRRSNPGT